MNRKVALCLSSLFLLSPVSALANIFDYDLAGTTRTGTPGALEAGAASVPSQTCAEQSGVCCTSGQTCTGGTMGSGSDCASLCCTGGGTCETPTAAACDVMLPATYSNDVEDTGGKGSWTAHSAGPQSTILRVAMRFDLSSLPADQDVATAELSFNVSYVSAGLDTKTWSIGPYGGDGVGDPEADSGSAMYAACDVSSDNYVSAATELRTTGVKTFTLSSPSFADLETARDAGTIFALAVMMDDETGTDTFAGIDRFDQGSSMALHVTCAAPCVPSCTSVCGGEGDTCGGTCPLHSGVACTDDGNNCTTDTCSAGTCVHVALPECTRTGGSPSQPSCGCQSAGPDSLVWLVGVLLVGVWRRRREVR
ncbi:MAG: MYXO-CTERM sorting domain-containing protein [Myxococcota bacterium]